VKILLTSLRRAFLISSIVANLFVSVPLILSQEKHPVLSIQDSETQAGRDARMRWWRDGRLGMFIRWGLYAVPAGSSNGKSVSGVGERILQDNQILLTSPLDYEVFQRTERLRGKVEIRGRTYVSADRAEARLTGTSLIGPLHEKWVRLHFVQQSGEFYGTLKTTPGGFYRLEVKVFRHDVQVAETDVPHVGLGEMFLVSGQSNSTNYGESRQQTSTRMVVAFDGNQWRIADDPQPGVQDDSNQGSFIPAFGDTLYTHIHVPIGVASVGYGGTSARQWLPAGERIYVMPWMTEFVKHNAANELVSDGVLSME